MYLKLINISKMKKLYTLSFLLAAAFSFAQTPIITAIMDGDCPGGNPKVLEIYASGTVDFGAYSVENQTNATVGTWTATLSLASLGTVTNDFVYVILGGNSATVPPIDNLVTFNNEIPGIAPARILNPPTGTGNPQPMNVNGDDRLRIINASTLAVVDQFGASDIDGTGTAWEYLDSWAKRNNGTGPNGSSFDSGQWTFGGVSSLDGLGTCQSGASFGSIVNFGQFTLATQQFAIAGLKVYPNPVTKGNLFITSDSHASKQVVIFDVLGKQVVNTTVNDQPINVANLNSGVYIVKITEEGKTATKKLVIQ